MSTSAQTAPSGKSENRTTKRESSELRGVIDVGSNTVRLLVGKAKSGSVEAVLDRSEFVRLGSGVDKSGNLDPDREQAAIAAISSLVGQAKQLGANNIKGIATSAVRDAANGKAFGDRVRRETGVELDIISGDREASLTFTGATSGLEIRTASLVCDLGGGSGELICADESGVEWCVSLPLGSGRLTERFVHHDPPSKGEMDEVRSFVAGEMRNLHCSEKPKVIFTGGTATHLAAMAGSADSLTEIDLGTLRAVLGTLSSTESSQIAAKYGFSEERAKVLPAGAAAVLAIAEHFSATRVLVTRQGIREGLLLEDDGE